MGLGFFFFFACFTFHRADVRQACVFIIFRAGLTYLGSGIGEREAWRRRAGGYVEGMLLLFEAMLVCRKLVVRCCAMLAHVPNRRIRESVLRYYASTHSQSKHTYKERLRQIRRLWGMR